MVCVYAYVVFNCNVGQNFKVKIFVVIQSAKSMKSCAHKKLDYQRCSYISAGVSFELSELNAYNGSTLPYNTPNILQ